MTPKAAIDFAADTLLVKDDARERVVMITLNNSNGGLRCHLVGIGGYRSCISDRRYVAKQALLDNAVAVIMLHNHNGDCKPSQADIRTTEEIKGCLAMFDITLLDHVVVGDGCYFSFAEERVYDMEGRG